MTIRELIEKINIFDVNVTFEPLEKVREKFSAGIVTPLAFSCVEGKERKKYEKLANKSAFERHSAAIHIPTTRSYALYLRGNHRLPAAIVGAGEAGVRLLEELQNNPESQYPEKCFLTTTQASAINASTAWRSREKFQTSRPASRLWISTRFLSQSPPWRNGGGGRFSRPCLSWTM